MDSRVLSIKDGDTTTCWIKMVRFSKEHDNEGERW